MLINNNVQFNNGAGHSAKFENSSGESVDFSSLGHHGNVLKSFL